MKELVSIQSQLNAPKGQWNSYGKYRYRSCEDILAAVKPLLTQEKCTLTISDDVVLVGSRIYIKATATLTNDKGEHEITTAFAREDEAKKGMDGSQVTGSSSSYARKYALNGLFAIDDTNDADTLNNNPQYTNSAEPEADIIEKQVLPAIRQAKAKEDLAKIYNEHQELHENPAFMSALTSRRKELGIKNSNDN